MRSLTANAIIEIAKQYGSEPLTIISIDWKGDNGPLLYADKDLDGIEGKIVEISPLESQITPISGNSTQVSVVLDDTDGTIKSIINNYDPHKRKCIIYQHFATMSLSDKFILMKGELASPFVWNEGDRTVSFTIMTEIENKEIGFSLEETQIDFLNVDDIGKAWPLVFGECVHVPTVQVKKTNSCTTQETLAYVDPMFAQKKQMLRQAYMSEAMIKNYFEQVFSGANSIAPEVKTLLERYVALIKEEDQYQIQMNELLYKLEEMKRYVDEGVDLLLIRQFQNTDIPVVEQQIEDLSVVMNVMQGLKYEVEQQAELADKEAKIKAEALSKHLEAYNNMRSIYADYLDLATQECEQQQLVKSVIRVNAGEKFPQNTPMDVLIKNVQWRVSFDGDLMTILAGPIPKYRNITASPATLDSCEFSTVSSFMVPAGYDLRDTYIWCKNKNYPYPAGRMHILRVTGQIGQRVYFELVPFVDNQDNSSGSGGGLIKTSSTSLPYHPGKVLQSELNGANINANFDACTDLSDEVINFLGDATLALINRQEIETLLKLQCNLSSDEQADALIVYPPTQRDIYTLIGEDIGEIVEVAGTPLPHWFEFQYNTFIEEIPSSGFYKADPGSLVIDINNICELHIVNLIPSTIKAVHAYRTVEDERFLAPIPSSYYTKNENEVWENLNLTTLRFKIPLSWYNEGWEDTVYVTQDSSVGPNVVDILEYLIETYTDKTVDTTTFNAVRTQFDDLYPANFALFSRMNVFEILNNIAWQARCVLILSNDIFYIKYLSDEPTSIRTFNESDVELSTLTMSLQETEDLTTKMICTWRPNYLADEPVQEIVLRNNVSKYGLHEANIDFFIYNIPELIIKSATFWLIRRSNSWKYAKFKTFLTQLELEAFDCVTLDFAGDYFSNSAVKAIVETNEYDPNTNSISLSLWLPVKVGTMEPDQFAWPAGLAADVEYVATGGTGIGTNIVTELLGCN